MKIDILTLFPKMFAGPFAESIVKRAQNKGLVEISIHDLRQWTDDKRKTVDDRPFGGGVGMILKVEPVYQALQALTGDPILDTRNSKHVTRNPKTAKQRVILLTPQGKVFNQAMARQLANLGQLGHLVLICGHYEGVDERIRQHLVDQEISIGDYVLTGGELPAMVVTDAIVRLLPGVLEKSEATKNESFSSLKIGKLSVKGGSASGGKIRKLLEYPQYTRPTDFKGWKVPEMLLSGNHQKVAAWREKQALTRTKLRRPDLLK